MGFFNSLKDFFAGTSAGHGSASDQGTRRGWDWIGHELGDLGGIATGVFSGHETANLKNFAEDSTFQSTYGKQVLSGDQPTAGEIYAQKIQKYNASNPSQAL